MLKKVLSINTPYINTYPDYGMLFSIIGNNEKDWEWIFCNFIQLEVRYHKGFDYYFTCFRDHNDIWMFCPSIMHYKIPEKIINDLFHCSFTDFILYCLDQEMYFYCLLDYSKVDSIKSNIVHNCFFYGYNKSEKIFYIRDNLERGKFTDFTIYFHEVELSLKTMMVSEIDNINYIQSYNVIQKNPSNLFKYNIDFIQNELKTYLGINGYTSNFLKEYNRFDSYKSVFEDVPYVNLGLYDFFKKILLTEVERGYDLKTFYLLCEHKKMMKARTEFLLKRGYIKEIQLQREMEDLEEQANKLLLVSMKLNQLKKIDNERLITLIDELHQKDIKATTMLVDALDRM